MFITWGKDGIFLYNDAYCEVVGDKHPFVLGKRFKEAWEEVWHEVGGIYERALTGKGEFCPDTTFFFKRRDDLLEEIHIMFSYNPLIDDKGKVKILAIKI